MEAHNHRVERGRGRSTRSAWNMTLNALTVIMAAAGIIYAFLPFAHPLPLPAPPFTIRPYDPQRDQAAQCLICLIPGWQGPTHPGDYQWSLTASANEGALLSMNWCANNRATLRDNLDHMRFELLINGYSVEANKLAEAEATGGQGVCRSYTGVLTGWAPGRHSYVWVQHVHRRLSDGWGIYEPGEYLMEFDVYVR